MYAINVIGFDKGEAILYLHNNIAKQFPAV